MLTDDRDRMGLLIILVIVGGLFFALFKTYSSYTKERDEKINQHLDQVIEVVAEDGYITENTTFEIERFIDDLTSYDWVEIEGTLTKVDSGEDVNLIVTMGSNGLFGGKGDTNKFFKESIAK